MKTRRPGEEIPSVGWSQTDRGSTLISAAITAAILSIMIAGVMTYLANEFRINARTHAYNQALYMAEAAVEIACAEINYQYAKEGPLQSFKGSRGWQQVGPSGTIFSKTVNSYTDNSGRTMGRLSVTVFGVGAVNPVILGVGTCTASGAGAGISRAVRVTLKSAGNFPFAFLVKQTIDFSGNSIFTDSYDSSDPTKSTGGQYDPAKRQPNGSIASIGDSIVGGNSGNASVFGNVYVTPTGTMSMTANGSVGATFVAGQRCNTVPCSLTKGWLRTDLNTSIPDVVMPPELLTAPSLGYISGAPTIPAGDYRATGMAPSGPVVISGNVRLYVTGDITINGSGAIDILPGASLTVYTTASSVKINGGGVVNGTNLAQFNQWYTLPGVSTDFRLGGSASWTGVAYVPDADVTIGGGSPNFNGAIVARSVRANGSIQFHYDEALGMLGSGYSIASWETVRASGGTWVPE